MFKGQNYKKRMSFTNLNEEIWFIYSHLNMVNDSREDKVVYESGRTDGQSKNARMLIRFIRNNAVLLVYMSPVMYIELTSLIPHRG